MRRKARYLLVVVLCGAMTPSLHPGTASTENHPKKRHERRRSPELQTYLLRGGNLSPDLKKRIEPLSDDREWPLQPLFRGYARGIVERSVIVESHTQRVIDTFRYAKGH